MAFFVSIFLYNIFILGGIIMHHEIRTYLRRLAMEHIKPNYAELGRAFNVDPRTIKKAFLEMQSDNSNSDISKSKPSILDPYKELLEQKFNYGVNAHAAYHFIRHKDIQVVIQQ